MRTDDPAKILSEITRRVLDERRKVACTGGTSFEEMLAESLYHEQRRLKADRGSRRKAHDGAFWRSMETRLKRGHAHERGSVAGGSEALLREAILHYGTEIAGHFSEPVYQICTRIVPPALGLLLNAITPRHLIRRLPQLPKIDESVIIQGETEKLKQLCQRGTVILVPTHVSHLDSIVIGYALYRLGLPPFVYGAGLNLFDNPLIGFFMHHLGAYTIDRKKTDPLYKDILKEYATATLEYGYHTLFFPGGTRSRSGAIERRLKMGLLGTGLSAYINNLRQNKPKPNIYIVPATLSYQLVLEAETLIDDFLTEKSQAIHIIEDDEFSRPRRVFEFASQLLALDSHIEVTIGRALDPFGNAVDDQGISHDPCGRSIDITRYLGPAPSIVADRDMEYTRELSEQITQVYAANNVIASTHALARVVFMALSKRDPKSVRLLRENKDEEGFELSQIQADMTQLITHLRGQADQRRLRLGTGLQRASAQEIIADGLRHFACYHQRPAAIRRGDRLYATNIRLLLYYQNRVELC